MAPIGSPNITRRKKMTRKPVTVPEDGGPKNKDSKLSSSPSRITEYFYPTERENGNENKSSENSSGKENVKYESWSSSSSPHKIQYKGPSSPLAPAASAFNKLKISILPKKSISSHDNKSKKESLASRNQKRSSENSCESYKLNHRVTEYFPIRRRSERKPKKELDKEINDKIERFLISNLNDSDLGLSIQHYSDKGRGISAAQDFSKGDFVVEYAGDLIEVNTAKEREFKYSKDSTTGCYMYYFKHQGKQFCVDATKETGRLGRLINHSRLHPNLVTKVVMIKETPRLILVAKDDLQQGVELLYDYGDRSKESLKAHPWLNL